MEVHHMCDDNVELVCHVEYDTKSGNIHAIIPFYIDKDERNSSNEREEHKNIKERLAFYREAVELTAIDCIREAMGDQPAYNPWIPCGVRRPSRHDADPYNRVIAWDAIHQQAVSVYPEEVETRKCFTHWKPTNLPKESAPI